MRSLSTFPATLIGSSPEANGESDAKRTVAIAKCQKRLEAARHLYEDGELEREAYLSRKAEIEEPLTHWRNLHVGDLADAHPAHAVCRRVLPLVDL